MASKISIFVEIAAFRRLLAQSGKFFILMELKFGTRFARSFPSLFRDPSAFSFHYSLPAGVRLNIKLTATDKLKSGCELFHLQAS